MEINEKLKRSKKLIFFAWVISVFWDLLMQLLSVYDLVEYGTGSVQWWVVIVYILATVLLLYGLWLGSRSIEAPLSISRFLNLLFGYPCWIPVSVYLVINLVIPIIYFKYIK